MTEAITAQARERCYRPLRRRHQHYNLETSITLSHSFSNFAGISESNHTESQNGDEITSKSVFRNSQTLHDNPKRASGKRHSPGN